MVTLVVKDGHQLNSSARILGLAGIKEDLNLVCDMSLTANGLMGGDPQSVHSMAQGDLLLLQALYSSAVVTYARCFNSGVRTRLEEHHVRLATGDQADQAIVTHRRFLALRDRHVAHSVNSHEEGILGVVVEGEPTRVRDLVWHLSRHSVAPDGFHRLWSLADVLLPVVNAMVEKASVSALAEAQTLTPEKLDALPEAEFIPPSGEHLTDARGDHRGIPEQGAWGYVLAAEYPEEVDGDGPRLPKATDGPDRPRKIVVVSDPTEQARWRDLGHDQAP
jgi:hypothetical protein